MTAALLAFARFISHACFIVSGEGKVEESRVTLALPSVVMQI